MADTDYGAIAGGAGALVGLGASAFGGYTSYEAARQEAGIQTNIIGLEQQANQTRRTAMELNARRQSMEVLRHAQVARSMALSTSVGQGAQFSSSASGAQAQETSQGGTNLLGISQNLQLGEQMFNIQDQISQQRIAMAQAKAKEAEGQGIASFGRSFGQSIGPLVNMGLQLGAFL